MPTVGGDVELVAPIGGVPSTLAVDATGVYWSTLSTGVFRAPLEGGGVQELSAIGGNYMAMDATHVYWSNQASGEILKILKVSEP